jgi:asparagine synthase (glutamine-hydrolysing)
MLPKSRESRLGNRIRQYARFAEAARLKPAERYWRLCGYTTPADVEMLMPGQPGAIHEAEWTERRAAILSRLQTDPSLEAGLRTDLGFILPNDMLYKVDLMSMAHSLEVRVPFLDHHLVEFATSLPLDYKITLSSQKRIVKDAFREVLPPPLLSKPKQGFEVPMLQWLRHDLKPKLDELLAPAYVHQQGLFDSTAITRLRARLNSSNPGDAAARMYGLLVFQYWWRTHLR